MSLWGACSLGYGTLRLVSEAAVRAQPESSHTLTLETAHAALRRTQEGQNVTFLSLTHSQWELWSKEDKTNIWVFAWQLWTLAAVDPFCLASEFLTCSAVFVLTPMKNVLKCVIDTTGQDGWLVSQYFFVTALKINLETQLLKKGRLL